MRGLVRLSVLIPAYNKGPTIRAIVERLLAGPGVHGAIVVGDCSTASTSADLADLSMRRLPS